MNDTLPGLLSRLINVVLRHKSESGWPRHPIDEQLGIETSAQFSRASGLSFLKPWQWRLHMSNPGYAPTAPSILRASINAIGDISGFTFVDIGCGMGRALAVATEFPFDSVVGIDFSSRICDIARNNAEIIAKQFPERPKITIINDDASLADLSFISKYMLYLYNQLNANLIKSLIYNISTYVRMNSSLVVFIIYNNPIHFKQLDSCPLLKRYFVQQIYYNSEDKAAAVFSYDTDTVVIYQSVGAVMRPARPGANVALKLISDDQGVEIVDDRGSLSS
ncbi:MAG TPA: hypothetical protein VEK34_06425 [Methylocella sp.]|nr:hypothetical protein [Methylocella sp.]